MNQFRHFVSFRERDVALRLSALRLTIQGVSPHRSNITTLFLSKLLVQTRWLFLHIFTFFPTLFFLPSSLPLKKKENKRTTWFFQVVVQVIAAFYTADNILKTFKVLDRMEYREKTLFFPCTFEKIAHEIEENLL